MESDDINDKMTVAEPVALAAAQACVTSARRCGCSAKMILIEVADAPLKRTSARSQTPRPTRLRFQSRTARPCPQSAKQHTEISQNRHWGRQEWALAAVKNPFENLAEATERWKTYL